MLKTFAIVLALAAGSVASVAGAANYGDQIQRTDGLHQGMTSCAANPTAGYCN